MNKKVLIGIIVAIVAVAIAVVCIVVSGDKDTDSKKDKDNKVEAEENNIALDPAERDERCKTCVDNQRELVSQISTYAMSNNMTFSGTITYTSDGEDYSDFYSDIEYLDEETFCSLFQYVPCCPACGSYKITVEINEENDFIKVSSECIDNEDGTEHKYN